MNIHPIRAIQNIVKRKVYQTKVAREALKNLEARYDIPYHSIHKNQSGTVGVLGYPDKVSPYSHAMCIFPDGTSIETLAKRGIEKPGGRFVDSFTKVMTDKDSHLQVKTGTVLKDSMGRVLKVESNAGDVFTVRKRPEAVRPDNVIDITGLLKKRK